ncbi:MAG TPA: response regulator [Gemmatimonadales bacterium]|nr:response regulator [Gemmatimonadales bacterium]
MPRASAEAEGTESRPAGQRPVRVLLVDDNAVNQRLAARLLQKLGCEVTVASSGREAVEAIALQPQDLVIMDCQMPDLDGYAATQQIRDLEGTSRRTPIVAMTAHAMRGDRERCLAAGMDDYYSKPVTGADFIAMINRWGR